MKVSEIVKVTGGRLVSGRGDVDIDPARISTDSRTIACGDFFVGLDGPNFKGCDFVDEVFNKGAAGVLVTGLAKSECESDKIVITVKDTTKALQDIAHAHRMKFKMPLIGITGSSGKTTTKEMIAFLLEARYKVLKNEGTKNNHIGVPQTLLKLNRSHDICVLEMGTNHFGEIRRLAQIARPTVAVIMNVGPSHLEFLKDLEGVFKAKEEITEYLPSKSLLVINGDDPYLIKIKSRKFRIHKFGFGENCDFKATSVTIDKNKMSFILNGYDEFELKLVGRHNISNALAAIAVGAQFGVSYRAMKRKLALYRPPRMRLDVKIINGITIINDSYNSNPLSMKAALDALDPYKNASRWVVSGDMLELGKTSERLHRDIGELIAQKNVDGLLTFGKFSIYTYNGAFAKGMDKSRLWHLKTHAAITKILKNKIKRGDVILVKGSRGMNMEKVLEGLS